MNTWFEDQLAQYQNDADFTSEGLLLDINEQIVQWMEKQGVKRRDLAERMGVTRAYITRLLNGHPNLSIKTLCKVSIALGLDVNVQLALPALAQDHVVSFGKPIFLPPERPGTRYVDQSALAA